MSWESREGRGRYYTRTRRVDGRVVRRYVGKGLVGEYAAFLDAESRARRAAEALALTRDRERLTPLDDVSVAYDDGCKLLLAATLAAAGYHRHQGSWRRRRVRRDENASRDG